MKTKLYYLALALIFGFSTPEKSPEPNGPEQQSTTGKAHPAVNNIKYSEQEYSFIFYIPV